MPLVEAMASGCPVAASARGAIAEVCGDAALAFDPMSEEAIADAIGRIVADDTLRARLRTAGLGGRRSSAGTTWPTGHVAVYRRVLTARMAR